MTKKWSRAVLRGLGSSNAPRLPDHIFRNAKPANRRMVGVFVQPTQTAIQRIRRKIKVMTSRRTLNDDYLSKLQALNALLKGWTGYYRAVNPMQAFKELDRYVWERLSRWVARKYRIGTHQVRRRYQARQAGPRGGTWEFSALDESTGQGVWRFRATQTRLIRYRPSFKRHWPHPYLERVTTERFEAPFIETRWTGIREAPVYEVNRRHVLGRAKGACERCGKAAPLAVHHKHRVGGRGRLRQADHRPEMLEALCKECHAQEQRAEVIARTKMRKAQASR